MSDPTRRVPRSTVAFGVTNEVNPGAIDDAASQQSNQSAVVSLSTQLKQIDLRRDRQLQDLADKYKPELLRKKRQVENAKKKLTDILKKFETQPSGDGVALLKQEYDKAYQMHEDAIMEYDELEEQYGYQEQSIMNRAHHDRQERHLLYESAAEQALDSDDEAKVKYWDQQQFIGFDFANVGYPLAESTKYDPGMGLQGNMQYNQQQATPRSRLPVQDNQGGRRERNRSDRSATRNDDVITVNQLTKALGRAFGKGQHELPEFNGRAEDWPIFQAEFNRTKADYEDSQNCSRLRKALKGQAKEAVVGLLDDPGSIYKVIQILENRFGRSEFVIEALIKKVRDCAPPDPNKPESIVNFGTVVQHLVARIKSLKKMNYLNNTTLLKEMVDKLPPMVAEQWITWQEYRNIFDPNLEDFGNWIETKVNRMVRLCKPAVIEAKTDEKPKGKGKRGSVVATVSSADSHAEEPIKCGYCNKDNHGTAKCWFFKKKDITDRWNTVREKKLCFICLQQGHQTFKCKDKDKECGKDGCTFKHHQLLHSPKRNDKKPEPKYENVDNKVENTEPTSPPAGGNPGPSSKIAVHAVMGKASKPLSIVPVKIRGPGGTKKTYALLDSGADTTVIDRKLAEELQLGKNSKEFVHRYKGVSGSVFEELAKRVDFEIAGEYKGARFYDVSKAVTVQEIGVDPYTMKIEDLKKKYPFLRRAKLKSISNATTKIIIGEDYPHLSAHREIVERCYNEPMAKRTKLGWVLGGRDGMNRKSSSAFHMMVECNNEALDAMMRESFSLASFGVVPQHTKGSIQDQRALGILEKTTVQKGDRWECGLLWRDDDVKLPESKGEAMTRLIQNEKRMKRDTNYASMYHKKIQEYHDKGYIRKLTRAEAAIEEDRSWYIPHFGVTSVNKPGKFRLVFDAASRSENVCLNDNLLKGPDLIRSLVAVLWNFRVHNIAITGDIEDMFHRVLIRKEDQNSQRFLWRNLESAMNKEEPDVFVMTVMIFGASSSPSSAIYVKNRNAECCREEMPEASRATIEDFYVDDCLSGASTSQEAIELRNKITELNARGGFHVKKWLSNCEEVIQSIPEDYRAVGVKDLNVKSVIPSERVLGLWWEPTSDCFTFKANFTKIDPEILDGRRPTKREMCSLVMSLYDPVGFVNNLKIKGMILLQQTWRLGVEWDAEVPDSIYNDWKAWLEYLKTIENVKIPRKYCQDLNEADWSELHTFVDASEEAYAAVSYLRIIMKNEVIVSFVASKVRVAPLKKVTIPRLELLAAILGARLATTIISELRVKINRQQFWSDSKTVLQWIKSESLRLPEFVANRVGEIQELTNPADWRWIPSDMNPADEATRLKTRIIMTGDSVWLRGPAMLLEDPGTWPVGENLNIGMTNYENEVKPANMKAMTSLGDAAGIGRSIDERCGFAADEVVSRSKMAAFSKYDRLLRVSAGVISAARFWKAKAQGNALPAPPWKLRDGAVVPKQMRGDDDRKFQIKLKKFLGSHLTSDIDPDVICEAELMLVKTVQQECYAEEVRNLQQGNMGKVNKKSSLRKLSPFLDGDEVLRVQGRIGNARDVPLEMKHPIILPTRHPLTELIIMREHENNAHQGRETTMNNLRQRYWVINPRAAVRRACEKCQFCAIRRAKPIIPKMGDLPHYRLSFGEPPFTYTGVDFFGPIEVTVARRHEKRWVALFTCLVTRAIHLEVAYGLSSDEMLLVLSRFVDQRGRPCHIYSDNGTNFVGTNKELKENWKAIDWNVVRSSNKLQPIKWHFIPAFSPHMGGVWERMVQSVKKVVRTTLHEKYPKDQVLATVLKGAENIINSRPLTYVSGDPNDEESITPNHFLRGAYFVGPSIPGKFEASDEILRKNWRKAQILLDHFWQRWTREYLPELNRRSKWQVPVEPLQVGDVVLLVDDQQPRNSWAKGIITTTFPGSDGQVRVVEVTVRDFATKKTSAYRRSVDKIIPLNIRC